MRCEATAIEPTQDTRWADAFFPMLLQVFPSFSSGTLYHDCLRDEAKIVLRQFSTLDREQVSLAGKNAGRILDNMLVLHLAAANPKNVRRQPPWNSRSRHTLRASGTSPPVRSPA